MKFEINRFWAFWSYHVNAKDPAVVADAVAAYVLKP